MTKKIVRARLYSVENEDLQIKFQCDNGERGVVATAGTIKKDLGNTKDVLFTTDDRRGELPYLRRNENGTITLEYTANHLDIPQIVAARNTVNQLAEILKQGSGQDIDELVRFEYELPNDLLEDVITRQGQHKRYAKVIDIEDVDRGDMSDVGRFQGDANRYVGEIRITCIPFTFGNLDKYGYNDGSMMATNSGTLIGSLNNGETITNYIKNPSFSHDNLMEGWTYNAANLNIKRLPESESFLDNDILITNLTNSTEIFETSVSEQNGNFIISALVKRVDGAAVTSSDIRMVVDSIVFGGAFLNVEKSPYNDYYSVNWFFQKAVGSFTCGWAILGNKQLIMSHTQLILTTNPPDSQPYPFIANGDLAGHEWQGERHNSLTQLSQLSLPQNSVIYKNVDWLERDFTFNVWITTPWDTPLGNTNAEIVRYTSVAGSFVLYIDQSNNNLVFNSTGVSDSFSTTISYGTNLMITLSVGGSANTAKIYINGEIKNPLAPVVLHADFLGGGDLEIGKDSNIIFDDLKIYDTVLSQESVANLYNQELPTKAAGKALSNGIPCFFSEALGKVGSMIGFNTLGSSTVTSRNTIIVFGSVGDGSADIEMELESLDNIFANRLVTTSIPTPKQFLYDGTFYLDFQGKAEDDPNNGYTVNMQYTSPSVDNTLQPGLSFVTSFTVGRGGQQVFNEYPIATQRPKMLAGEYAIMVRFLHISNNYPNGNFTSEVLFGYGVDLESIYQTIERGNIDWNNELIFALMTYMDGATLKNMSRQGPQALNFGMRFTNNDIEQTFVALDIIHIVKNPQEFLFDGYTGIGQKLVIATGKPVLTLNTDGYSSEIGDLVSNKPFIVQPDKYVYIPFDFSEKTFNVRIRGQNEQVRKKVFVDLWLRPSYKF